MAEVRAISQAQAELLAAFHVQSETTKLLLQSQQEQLRKIFERLEDHHETIYIGNSTPSLRTQTRELTKAVEDLRTQTHALTTTVEDLRTQLQVSKTVPAISLPPPPGLSTTQATVRIALVSAFASIITTLIAGGVAISTGGKVTKLLYWLADPPMPWSR